MIARNTLAEIKVRQRVVVVAHLVRLLILLDETGGVAKNAKKRKESVKGSSHINTLYTIDLRWKAWVINSGKQ